MRDVMTIYTHHIIVIKVSSPSGIGVQIKYIAGRSVYNKLTVKCNNKKKKNCLHAVSHGGYKNRWREFSLGLIIYTIQYTIYIFYRAGLIFWWDLWSDWNTSIWVNSSKLKMYKKKNHPFIYHRNVKKYKRFK